jgi:hypothetical protein
LQFRQPQVGKSDLADADGPGPVAWRERPKVAVLMESGQGMWAFCPTHIRSEFYPIRVSNNRSGVGCQAVLSQGFLDTGPDSTRARHDTVG